LSDKKTLKPLPKPRGGEWSMDDPKAQKLVDDKKAYWAKQLTPEQEQFAKVRNKIQNDMDEKGYTPYFDPAKRQSVDPRGYPTKLDMTKQAVPAKAATVQKYREMYDTPEARARLQAAYDEGRKIPDADRWYWVKQLEDQFKKEYGDVEGVQRFRRDFADSMAATTGGATPTANYLMARCATPSSWALMPRTRSVTTSRGASRATLASRRSTSRCLA
jgi:hypothetical protein